MGTRQQGARRARGVAVIFALVFGLIGLGWAAPVMAQDEETIVADATVRFVNAVVGGPEVDVLLDGQVLSQGVPYGVATDYVPVTPGDHVLSVVPTGQPADAALIEQDLGAEAAQAYVFTASGPLNDVEARLFDVNLEEMTPGMARGRAINLAADAGGIDLAATGGDTLFTDVGYGDAGDYADLTPGAYSFDLRGDDEQILGSAADVQIDASNAYDLLAIGQIADGSLTLLTLVTTVDPTCGETLGVEATTEDACVRVTHAAPGSAATDVYINDSPAANGLEFGTATEFIAVPAGEGRVFQVTAASAPIEEALLEAEYTLDAGQAYEILVTGAPDDLGLLITGIDLRPVPENQARLGVIHASPDTGSIDIGITDGPDLFTGLEYRGVSEYIAVDTGEYAIQVRPAEDQMVALESALTVEPGTVYDVVAVGRSDDRTLALFVLTAPVPVREGDTELPAENLPATPAAASTVEAVETLVPAEDATATAEAAQGTAVPTAAP